MTLLPGILLLQLVQLVALSCPPNIKLDFTAVS